MAKLFFRYRSSRTMIRTANNTNHSRQPDLRAFSTLERLRERCCFFVGLWNPTCGIRTVIPVLYTLCSGVFAGFGMAYLVMLLYDGSIGTEIWFQFHLIVLVGFSAVQPITYLILLFFVSRLSRRTLSDAFTLVCKQDWWIINFQIVIYLLVVLSFCIVETVFTSPLYVPFLSLIFWLFMGPGTGCWLFAIMTTALQQKVEPCLNQIKQLQRGTIDDVIDIHERLCEHVFEKVAALKTWFIIHWFSNLVLCVLTVVTVDKLASAIPSCYRPINATNAANVTLVIEYIPKCFYSYWVCTLVSIVWYSFITPCVYASRLTGSCSSIIDHLNKTKRRDWNPGHPLSRRANLNHFLTYVKRRKCGFKIGQLTFDSRVSWLSFFLSFCGIAVKLFT